MASVAQPLASDKFAALGLLDKQAIEQICREQGHQWKEVKLPPGKTLQCFGWQVLMGNVPLDAVAHHQQMQFSGPAFCMARQRLPLELMQEGSRRQESIQRTMDATKASGCIGSTGAAPRCRMRRRSACTLAARECRSRGAGIRRRICCC